MATGINLDTAWLASYTRWGYPSYTLLRGTDDDDTINVKYDMYASYYCTTEIKLLDGNDTVSIGGRMNGHGKNIISGGNGNKTITVANGMDGSRGAKNTISLGGTAEDTHTIALGKLVSNGVGHNKIITGEGTDNIIVVQRVQSFYQGLNSIELGDGTKNLTFGNNIEANFGGKNIIKLGNGEHKLTVYGNVDAAPFATNNISTESGDTVLDIKGRLFSSGMNGKNSINLGEGNHEISMYDLVASQYGTNEITTAGTTKLTIVNNITSYGINHIKTGAGNDEVIIKGGLYAVGGVNIVDVGAGDNYIYIGKVTFAAGGSNYILTGDGNNTVEIHGTVYSTWGHSTYINAGSGNDNIIVDGYITKTSLYISAGEGYDTLSLMALSAMQFTGRYESWLNDLASTKGLTATGLNFFNVKIDSANNLTQIDWLTKLVNNHNAENADDQIYIGINIDGWGSAFSLNHLFSAANEKAINTVDLTGSHASELTIKDFLSTNGYNNSVLHVNGNTNDTVKFNDIWTQTQTNVLDEKTGIIYNVYHNANNEDVFVQAGVNVLFV